MQKLIRMLTLAGSITYIVASNSLLLSFSRIVETTLKQMAIAKFSRIVRVGLRRMAGARSMRMIVESDYLQSQR